MLRLVISSFAVVSDTSLFVFLTSILQHLAPQGLHIGHGIWSADYPARDELGIRPPTYYYSLDESRIFRRVWQASGASLFIWLSV